MCNYCEQFEEFWERIYNGEILQGTDALAYVVSAAVSDECKKRQIIEAENHICSSEDDCSDSEEDQFGSTYSQPTSSSQT